MNYTKRNINECEQMKNQIFEDDASRKFIFAIRLKYEN